MMAVENLTVQIVSGSIFNNAKINGQKVYVTKYL
jgi:hypothetical protein